MGFNVRLSSCGEGLVEDTDHFPPQAGRDQDYEELPTHGCCISAPQDTGPSPHTLLRTEDQGLRIDVISKTRSKA